MLTALWAKFEAWIIGLVAVLAAIGGALLYGREKGKAAEKKNVVADQAQQQINTATAIVDRSEVRKDVEVETAKLPADATAPISATPAESSSAPAAASTLGLILPLAALLTSCASSGVVTKPTPSNGCEWVRPIYISKADVLTQGTADQILNHDEAWQKICGSPTSRP